MKKAALSSSRPEASSETAQMIQEWLYEDVVRLPSMEPAAARQFAGLDSEERTEAIHRQLEQQADSDSSHGYRVYTNSLDRIEGVLYVDDWRYGDDKDFYRPGRVALQRLIEQGRVALQQPATCAIGIRVMASNPDLASERNTRVRTQVRLLGAVAHECAVNYTTIKTAVDREDLGLKYALHVLGERPAPFPIGTISVRGVARQYEQHSLPIKNVLDR